MIFRVLDLSADNACLTPAPDSFDGNCFLAGLARKYAHNSGQNF